MSNKEVLVVDDDPDMGEVMAIVLRVAGYNVRNAANGQEALTAVEQCPPALVLLDMLMPVMDGWQVARELRKRYGYALSIVAVTAAEHAEARVQELGVDDVLAKPFDIGRLLSVVDRYTRDASATQ